MVRPQYSKHETDPRDILLFVQHQVPQLDDQINHHPEFLPYNKGMQPCNSLCAPDIPIRPRQLLFVPDDSPVTTRTSTIRMSLLRPHTYGYGTIHTP